VFYHIPTHHLKTVNPYWLLFFKMCHNTSSTSTTRITEVCSLGYAVSYIRWFTLSLQIHSLKNLQPVYCM